MEGSVCQWITGDTLLSKHLCLQIFIAMRHWSGSSPLDSVKLSIVNPHPDSYPVVALCLRDPVALEDLQGQPLHILQQIRWSVRCLGWPSRSPRSGLGCQPTSSLISTTTGPSVQHCPSAHPYAAASKEWASSSACCRNRGAMGSISPMPIPPEGRWMLGSALQWSHCWGSSPLPH